MRSKFHAQCLASVCGLCLTGFVTGGMPVLAQETMQLAAADSVVRIDPAERKAFAQDFLNRMQRRYDEANLFLQQNGIEKAPLDLRGMADGELLILELIVPPRLKVEGSVIGEVRGGTILLSLLDFVQVLEFPISQNAETGVISGWFIRENKQFSFDPATNVVMSDGQEYKVGSNIIMSEEDILVPIGDIEAWFQMKINPQIGTQQLSLDPSHPLPATERYERRRTKKGRQQIEPPSLPRGQDDYNMIGFPSVDVNTRSSLSDRVGQERNIDHQVNLRSAGEFAYGTLTTNIAANDEDNITNARVSYLQESAYAELLGPLQARRLELGDLQPTRLPLTGGAAPETGVRVTNIDPQVRQTQPTTQIAGYIFPGWDVELYRENGLVAFQETNQDGYYSFDNVQLFSDRNAFRVVAYGPQGEVREENVSIPYDRNRNAVDGGIYDVSFTFQERQFYRKFDETDEDKDTPHVVGFYEIPVGQASAANVGFRSRQEEGTQKTYVSTGLSTSLAGALVNTTLAADESGELASEIVASKQFGSHNFRADVSANTDNYNPGQQDRTVEVFSTGANLEGPFPLDFGERPRYGVSARYDERADGATNYGGFLNLNTQFQRIGFNQSFDYNSNSESADGAALGGTTSLTGSFGKNSIRGLVNYDFQPDYQIESLTASWRHRLNHELETQLEVDRTLEDRLTEYSAQLNWRPDYVTISPRVSYDSEGNLEGVLNTRFGVTKVPDGGDFVFTRDSFTNAGALSAFVFFDKDGDLIFNNEDEPIEEARIMLPHNGGTGTTNAEGRAYISQLRPNIITDVFLDPSSLSDPFWVPAQKGVSIMPRTGKSHELLFPVHLAGEIDGTVYAKGADGSSSVLRGVILNLYDKNGELAKTTTAGSDGFYVFTQILPGSYTLIVDSRTVPKNIASPEPQKIQIGFGGDVLYGKDIFLQADSVDVSSSVLASLEDFKARHPHITFDQDPDLVLNLGSYNSNLMMALRWYQLSRRYGAILTGAKTLVPPAQSYADVKTGKHELRVAISGLTLSDAYRRCRSLVVRGFQCQIEILPGALADKSAPEEPDKERPS
jgi:hypothetical protein